MARLLMPLAIVTATCVAISATSSPSISNLAQFRVQCLAGVDNTQSTGQDRAYLARENFGVLQVGPHSTMEVMNPYNVCTADAPWTKNIARSTATGHPPKGDWDAKPLFLGKRSVLLFQEGNWQQRSISGNANFLPTGDTFNFGGRPSYPGAQLYNTIPPRAAGSSTVPRTLSEKDNTYQVVLMFNQDTPGTNKWMTIPCTLKHDQPGDCLSSYNETYSLPGIHVTQALSPIPNEQVYLVDNTRLVVSGHDFPLLDQYRGVNDPCGMVSNISMFMLYENQTFSQEQGLNTADYSRIGEQKYVFLHGLDADGWLRVCRLHSDLSERDQTNYSMWSTKTNIKATVQQVDADSNSILMSVKITINGQSQNVLLPIESNTGKVQIPHFSPGTSQITPTAVGLAGQRRFILQYDNTLMGVEVHSEGSLYFHVLWVSTVGCLNDPAVWSEKNILYCWSNGKGGVPSGELMMVHSLTGVQILDSVHNQVTYNAIHFGVYSTAQLGLPFQLSLAPKSEHPTLWFIGSKLPDQLIVPGHSARTDVHCLIGMALDIPRSTKCPLPTPAPNSDHTTAGSQAGGKKTNDGSKGGTGPQAGSAPPSPAPAHSSAAAHVAIVLVVLCLVGVVIGAAVAGYRKHQSSQYTHGTYAEEGSLHTQAGQPSDLLYGSEKEMTTPEVELASNSYGSTNA